MSSDKSQNRKIADKVVNVMFGNPANSQKKELLPTEVRDLSKSRQARTNNPTQPSSEEFLAEQESKFALGELPATTEDSSLNSMSETSRTSASANPVSANPVSVTPTSTKAFSTPQLSNIRVKHTLQQSYVSDYQESEAEDNLLDDSTYKKLDLQKKFVDLSDKFTANILTYDDLSTIEEIDEYLEQLRENVYKKPNSTKQETRPVSTPARSLARPKDVKIQEYDSPRIRTIGEILGIKSPPSPETLKLEELANAPFKKKNRSNHLQKRLTKFDDEFNAVSEKRGKSLATALISDSSTKLPSSTPTVIKETPPSLYISTDTRTNALTDTSYEANTKLIPALIQEGTGLHIDEHLARVKAQSLYNWTVAKHNFTEQTLCGFNTFGQLEGKIRYVRITDVDNDGELRDDVTKLYIDSCRPQHIIQDQDLFLAITASIGRTFLFEAEKYKSKEVEARNPDGSISIEKAPDPVFAYAYFFLRMRFNQELILPKYAFYFTKTQTFQDWAKAAATVTTIPGINSAKYASMPLPKPDLDTQKNIVKFLDLKTANIKEAIANYTQSIAYLNEYKMSVIDMVLRNGPSAINALHQEKEKYANLDREHAASGRTTQVNFSFGKKVGVEAGDQQDQNFQASLAEFDKKLKAYPLTKVKYTLLEPIIYGNGVIGQFTGNIRQIRITDIDQWGKLKANTALYIDKITDKFILEDRDILVARSGSVGKSFIYIKDENQDEPHTFAGYLLRIRLNPQIMIPEFYYYFTKSTLFWEQIAQEQTQTTIPNVNADKYGKMLLPFPPLEDQRKIVDFLKNFCNKIDQTIQTQTQIIEYLKEYKTSIIENAVIGNKNQPIEIADYLAKNAYKLKNK